MDFYRNFYQNDVLWLITEIKNSKQTTFVMLSEAEHPDRKNEQLPTFARNEYSF